MTSVTTIEGNYVLDNKARFGIVVSRFNSFIVEQLQSGCLDTLISHGANEKNITLVKAPGAFELPLVAKQMLNSKHYDAVIALGAVIRGGTPHFEYVSGECAKGLASVSMSESVPVVFGVLTVDTIEQAIERAGTKAGNKGSDAAMTAIEMISLMKQLA